jgi:DNA-directed RNA polymerase specialized sigma subunit
MNKAQQAKFDSLYEKHVSALKRQGKSEKTVKAYSRAVRRIAEHFDRCPDQLKVDDLEAYFTASLSARKTSSLTMVKT